MPVTIRLGGCSDEPCRPFAEKTHRQLSTGAYSWPCSVLPIPADFDAYLADHRTARKRAARAGRLGYRFRPIRRHQHEHDIYDINTSAPERQGRPMSDGYRQRPHYHPEESWPCDRHAVYPYGVLDRAGRLRAYLWLYRIGELAMVSSILGHADALRDDVMYLLLLETIRSQQPLGGHLFYNRHDSGTDGLRFYKERFGLEPARVEWLP